MDETDRPDDRRAAGSSVSPQQRISPSKESRSRQIRNPKTQENHCPPTAFLQNRILAQVKSPRRINRFRILHGRLATHLRFIMRSDNALLSSLSTRAFYEPALFERRPQRSFQECPRERR